MALTITDLIDEAAVRLQDSDHTRWGREELLSYFNAGQRALAEARPDQVAEHVEMDLAPGWRQSLPPGATNLVRVTHNIHPKQAAVTFTHTHLLDASVPDWRSSRERDVVVHYMHDLKDPYVFHVYPPVEGGVRVGAVVSMLPADAANEGSDPSVPVRWMDALLDYVLYRAWSKDGEYAANAGVAQAHFQLFVAAIGAQSQAAVAMADS